MRGQSMEKRIVLVVDDQMINRKILGKILEQEYEVWFACNGKECMEILEANNQRVNAVLLDIVMPEMDGFQVLEAMQKNIFLSMIPVVVSSQMGGDAAEIKALSLGAQDFISKPYKADIICHRLKNIIKLRENAALINSVEKDELTGVYNKQFFLQKVKTTLLENPEQDYDMICLDVERFKLVNDTFGMQTGDELLRHIADCLRKAWDEKNICGHFGADVFYILQPHVHEYTDELFAEMNEKINDFAVKIQIKACYGIYRIHDREVSVNAMCDRAQLATETIKGQYNQLFAYYDDKIRQQLLNERFITDCMQTALEEGQFHVYYQPKYELYQERIAGAEALVRWIHPERGFMMPGEFIPLFEKNGFITQMDQFVWEAACQELRERMDAGKPLVAISVNVSRADIYNPNLIKILQGLVDMYEIPIQYLHLEITETAYTESPQQIQEVLGQLQKIGFIIEMDDFGSGYSSLNMLAEIPIDILKLDMRFIKEETNYRSGKGILGFIISLAKWLNLPVVAEGVETREQLDTMRMMDCNYVQGYYFAKPMRKQEFEELLDQTPLVEMRRTFDKKTEGPEENEESGHKAYTSRVMLIVDDVEANRAVLAEAFEADYQIVQRDNGLTAWEYLLENYQKVDIVMLDLLMPIMDGFQLLERIRSDDEMKELPVVITSQGDEESEQRALAMNADDFISKPYKIEIVKHRVRNVLANFRIQQLQQEVWIADRKDIHIEHVGSRWDWKGLLGEIERLKQYFDLVRVVDPRNTTVYTNKEEHKCSLHGCFSIWGKRKRCNNCISLHAYKNKTRYSKLEYSDKGVFFVISQYAEVDEKGVVLEMVTRLEDVYVDNIFQKDVLFTKLDQLNRELELDELTGVYNRRHIDACLNKYIDHARQCGKNLGVAMIDIDGLKMINDTYGHLTGDAVIKRTASLLNNSFALNRGDFVARFGGDEFLVVCRDIGPAVFVKRLNEVLDRIQNETLEEEKEVTLSVSVGCVNLLEISEGDAKAVIALADKRLYIAKRNGRSCVVCTDV